MMYSMNVCMPYFYTKCDITNILKIENRNNKDNDIT